jgi:hypothetical protein
MTAIQDSVNAKRKSAEGQSPTPNRIWDLWYHPEALLKMWVEDSKRNSVLRSILERNAAWPSETPRPFGWRNRSNRGIGDQMKIKKSPSPSDKLYDATILDFIKEVIMTKNMDSKCMALEKNPDFDCTSIRCTECSYYYKVFQKKLTEESTVNALQKLFPHGHKGFIPMTIEEIELHSKKNLDYARGGKPAGNFDRVGAIVGRYPGINWGKPQNVAIFYLLKQLDAYLWLESQGEEGEVEGKDARLGDVSVYTKIARLIIRDEKKEAK